MKMIRISVGELKGKWHVFIIDNFGSYRITCHENSGGRKRQSADPRLFKMYYLSKNNAPIIALKCVSFENDLEGMKEIIGLNRLNRSQDKKSNILPSVHL